MAEKWRLKRTRQCKKCPWRQNVDPHDIPNGYSEEKHRALKSTIVSGLESLNSGGRRAMACHEAHDAQLWIMLFATSASRDGSVAIGTKELQPGGGICAADNGRVNTFRPDTPLSFPVGAPVPVDVMHFQEGGEVLPAAGTTATQECDSLKPGVVMVSPLPFRCLDAIPFIFPSRASSLPNVRPTAVQPPPLLDLGLDVMGFGEFARTCLTATRPAVTPFSVGAELFKRLRAVAEIAFLHTAIITPDYCLGWLMNQLGPGNNIGLRLRMLSCENARDIKLVGPQHERFEDTLP